jgi:hypothetical protein
LKARAKFVIAIGVDRQIAKKKWTPLAGGLSRFWRGHRSSRPTIGDQQMVEHALEGFLRDEQAPADPDHRDFPPVRGAVSGSAAHAEQFASLFHRYRKFGVIAFRHGASPKIG